jgi:hypothetical protein
MEDHNSKEFLALINSNRVCFKAEMFKKGQEVVKLSRPILKIMLFISLRALTQGFLA